MSTTHIWQEITFTRVEPTLEADGTITIVVPEGSREASDGDKRYGCWLCDLPLNDHTIKSPCTPAD